MYGPIWVIGCVEYGIFGAKRPKSMIHSPTRVIFAKPVQILKAWGHLLQRVLVLISTKLGSDQFPSAGVKKHLQVHVPSQRIDFVECRPLEFGLKPDCTQITTTHCTQDKEPEFRSCFLYARSMPNGNSIVPPLRGGGSLFYKCEVDQYCVRAPAPALSYKRQKFYHRKRVLSTCLKTQVRPHER